MMTDFKPDRSQAEPIYRQVAAYLKQRITEGAYAAGAALPSEFELAAALNVSRPTVRHALELLKADRLVEAVAGSGTFVSPAAGQPPRARKAARPRTGNLALIGPEMRDTFLMHLVTGAESVAAQHGYNLILANAGNQIPVEQKYLRDLWDGQRADGFILMPADAVGLHAELRELCADEAPIVFVDRYFEACTLPYVVSDNVQCGYLAAQHLIRLGHTRIGFVTRPNLYISSVAHRLQGYRQALEEAGITPEPGLVFQGLLPFLREIEVLKRTTPDLSEFDNRAIQGFLARPDRPTALIACNDLIALEVFDACRALGLRIPTDLALVGCDDDAVASLVTPPLTTVRQNAYAIGVCAAELLLRVLDGEPVEREHVLPVELIVRESCGAGHADPREVHPATAAIT
jgi:DNA-binding LacI/PurR family transcriptional regulator